MLAISCTANKDGLTKAEPLTFNVTIESPETTGTKTYADKDLIVLWNEGDQLAAFLKNQTLRSATFQGQDGDRSGEIKVTASFNQEKFDYNYAVYPYDKSYSLSSTGDALTLTIPATQSYAEDSFGQGANLMAAASADRDFKFKNVCGYLALKLYGEGVSVQSIVLEAKAIEPICGEGTVTFNDGIPSIAMTKNASNRVTLTCGTPIALSASADDYKEFWFAIAPGTLTQGFTVEITDTDGNVMKKSLDSQLEISRNTLSRMAPLKVETAAPDYDMVDLGLSVYWASSNVGSYISTGMGDYFAWGETAPKEEYTWATYAWGTSSSELTKYNATDKQVTLLAEDDAATQVMGEGWKTPTIAQWNELIENCKQENRTVNGVDGCLFTSKINGKSIYLPNARCYSGTSLISGNENNCGMYWTNSTKTYQGWPRAAFLSSYCNSGTIMITVHGDPDNEVPYNFGQERRLGLTVRAVKDKS